MEVEMGECGQVRVATWLVCRVQGSAHYPAGGGERPRPMVMRILRSHG